MNGDLIAAVRLVSPLLAASINWYSPSNLHSCGRPLNGREPVTIQADRSGRDLKSAVDSTLGIYSACGASTAA